jgi:hypothetical protein
VFTEQERQRVFEQLIEWAENDERIEQAAVVGSLAAGAGDDWSDIDLTLGVTNEVPVSVVVDDWTRRVEASLDAVPLLDLEAGATLYRVFLLPGCLQVDLSFAAADAFRKASDRFRPLFGAYKTAPPPQPSEHDAFGWALLYAIHARACIERERWWQAEHAVSQTRNHMLNLECMRRGLPTQFGRGFDDLPPGVLAKVEGAFVRGLEREELRRALAVAALALQETSSEVDGLPQALRARLDEFVGQLA